MVVLTVACTLPELENAYGPVSSMGWELFTVLKHREEG
jgi:hypothetical protein